MLTSLCPYKNDSLLPVLLLFHVPQSLLLALIEDELEKKYGYVELDSY